MENKPSSKYIEFGILCIDRDKLYYDNELIVRYIKSKCLLDCLPKQNITELLQECLVYILENNDINYDLLMNLNSDDNIIMDTLLRRSRMSIKLDYKKPKKNRAQLIKHYKDRMEILQGSVIAGSDSDEINEEILEILQKLYDYNELSKIQHTRLTAGFK